MTFADIVAALSKEFGIEIEIEEDTCAMRAEATDGSSVTILIQGLEDKGAVLMTADLGLPPPERLERLYRVLLEANDLFRNTAGATLSINPDTGNVRLQRYDTFGTLEETGPSTVFLAFADSAAVWRQLIADFRDAPPEEDNDMTAPHDAMLV